MIEKISCCGYRGFANEQTLMLALPNGEKGSGLTVLVGPNGGGKSTIIECFSKIVANSVSFTEGKRNKSVGDMVSIKISFDGKDADLTTVETGGSETIWSSPDNEKPKIYCLPSRRFFDPFFMGGTLDRETYIKNVEDTQFRSMPLNQFTARLFHINKHQEILNEMYAKILGKELQWYIDQTDSGRYYVKINKADSISHNSDGLGEGMLSLLFIADALAESSPDELIVIDEPELSLHPQLQIRLLNVLLELTKERQVVIATHSTNMISMEAAINGGQIARVFDNGKGSVIADIDDECRDYFKSFLHDIYNPHIWGSDARSCFFAEDGFIITEGQEDVSLLPHVLEQLGLPNAINFFGFGAGGSDNISKIAYIFKRLGFSHVGALFDGDKSHEYEEFKNKFSNDGFKAWLLPAEDIRNKCTCGEIRKQGLLNGKGNLKEEYKNSNDLKTMMNEMIKFSANRDGVE